MSHKSFIKIVVICITSFQIAIIFANDRVQTKQIVQSTKETAHIKNTRKYFIKKPAIKHKVKLYTFKVKNGSLHHDIIQFSQKYDYQLVWNIKDPATGLKADYNWLGQKTITKRSPLEILQQMVKPYHLSTHVWQANHIIKIHN